MNYEVYWTRETALINLEQDTHLIGGRVINMSWQLIGVHHSISNNKNEWKEDLQIKIKFVTHRL